jgi:hypothetical protein
MNMVKAKWGHRVSLVMEENASYKETINPLT